MKINGKLVYIYPNGAIRNVYPYIGYTPLNLRVVALQGNFTAEELRALADHMEEQQKKVAS